MTTDDVKVNHLKMSPVQCTVERRILLQVGKISRDQQMCLPTKAPVPHTTRYFYDLLHKLASYAHLLQYMLILRYCTVRRQSQGQIYRKMVYGPVLTSDRAYLRLVYGHPRLKMSSNRAKGSVELNCSWSIARPNLSDFENNQKPVYDFLYRR